MIFITGCGGDDEKNDKPVIYDLVAPDFIPLEFDETIFIRLTVSDPQSLDDIDKVFFIVEDPEGLLMPDTSYLYDTGVDGDPVAGDGVYTYPLTNDITPTEPGEYMYIFYALDKGGLYSDSLAWSIYIDERPNPYIYSPHPPEYLQSGYPAYNIFEISVSDPQGLENIDKVYFTIEDPDGAVSIDTSFFADDGVGDDSTAGDGEFVCTLSGEDIFNTPGYYKFHYGSRDIDGNQSNTLTDSLLIKLYDLDAPDSLQKGFGLYSILFIKAEDPFGASNIDSVFFSVVKPDGTPGNQFVMYDDGNLEEHGDSTANDNIYSLGIQAPYPTSQSGNYKFTFTSMSGAFQSNTVVKLIMAYDPVVTGHEKRGEYNPSIGVVDVW